MELTPKFLIEDVDFPIVRKGYDPDQVDTFLELVAGGVAQMQRQIAAAQERAERAEARRPLDDGAPPPLPVAQPQHQPVPQPQHQPQHQPQGGAFGTEEIQRTLVLAQRTADAAIHEAREEAERTLSEARNEANRLLETTRAEAARRDEEALLRLQTEVEELHRVRETMTGDIAVLERHAEQQRARLRWSVTELKRLLDDPAAFRVQGVPKGLSGTEAKVPSRLGDSSPALGTGPDSRPKERTPEPDAVIDLVESQPSPGNGQGHSNAPSHAQGNGNGNGSNGNVGAQQPSPFAPPQNGMGTPSGAAPQPMAIGSPMPVVPGQDHQVEDAFLTELRKAMTDDEPLGPRYPDDASGGADSAYHPDQPQSRFGRRH